MRLICSADIHCNDWHPHSVYDEEGVPSRLKAYATLGEDIATLAKEKEVDAIVLAGDIFHSPTSRPCVLNYGKRFFKALLAPGLPVITTIGQHDHDQKSSAFNPLHSVVASIIPEDDNLYYVQEPTALAFPGATFFVCPWQDKNPNEIPFEDADIFIGHGIVKGSHDPHGYQFMTGFNAEELNKRYALSIVGDLHQEQWLGNVLVPGVPVQNNWKDSENPGCWIVDFEDGEIKGSKHYSIFDLRNDGTYHRFLTTEHEERLRDSTDTVHYRLAKASKTKKPSLHVAKPLTGNQDASGDYVRDSPEVYSGRCELQ